MTHMIRVNSPASFQTTNNMMVPCRICSSVVERSHCVSLFSPENIKSNLASRMSGLLEVPISKGDDLPDCVCRACKGKFITVETKLESLRALAKSSYKAQTYPEQQPSSRKRTKDTSGTDASPCTTKSRPAAKRGVGRTLFPEENCKRNYCKL